MKFLDEFEVEEEIQATVASFKMPAVFGQIHVQFEKLETDLIIKVAIFPVLDKTLRVSKVGMLEKIESIKKWLT